MRITGLKGGGELDPERHKMVGYRRMTLVLFVVPTILVPVILPIYAYFNGELNPPFVLLSDLCSLPNPLYSSLLHSSWILMSLGATVVLNDYAMSLREKARAKFPPEILATARFRRFVGASSLFQITMTFLCAPGIWVVVMFPMPVTPEGAPPIMSLTEAYYTDFWNWFVPWFIHCLGAVVAFGGAAVNAVLYLGLMLPIVMEHQLEPEHSMEAKKKASSGVIYSCSFAGIVRMLQLTVCRESFAMAVLIGEIAILTSVGGGITGGLWHWSKVRDEEDPGVDFPGALCALFATDADTPAVEEDYVEVKKDQ